MRRIMDRREPVAFLSYVHADNANDEGNILEICRRLGKEVEARMGGPIHIFVDREDIDWGENWTTRINESLESATILIAIITPRYFVSRICRAELAKFLEREIQLGRSDLVLPIYYIDTPQLRDPGAHLGDRLAQEISKRQYVDWRRLRYDPPKSQAVKMAIADLAPRMERALRRGAERIGAGKERRSGKDDLAKTSASEMVRDDSVSIVDDPQYDWVNRHQKLAADLEPGTALLIVDSGPDAGERFLVDKDTTSVGRSSNNDIILYHLSVSRRHAEVIRIGGGFRVRDLDSTYGVSINGSKTEEQDLTDGDVIEFGEYSLIFVSRPPQDQ
jgi:hypothetical protein